MKIAFAIMIYSILVLIVNIARVIRDYEKSFSDQALYIVQTGSFVATLLLLWIATKVNLAFTDYCTLALISVRATTTFVLLHLIESGAEGFQLIDRKELNDSIPFVSISALLISICGWRVNLLISAPLAIFSSMRAVDESLSTSDDNMACYERPELIASRMGQRW